jgi:GTPase SAR1 family protein
VLVAGCTGAGKSTLINRVFGRVVARTGAGVPITQHFERYELENEAVVIYDSKGLEVGDHNEFIETTKSFLVDDTTTTTSAAPATTAKGALSSDNDTSSASNAHSNPSSSGIIARRCLRIVIY